MPSVRKIRMRKRFARGRFGMRSRGAINPKQRLAALRRSQVRRTRRR